MKSKNIGRILAWNELQLRSLASDVWLKAGELEFSVGGGRDETGIFVM